MADIPENQTFPENALLEDAPAAVGEESSRQPALGTLPDVEVLDPKPLKEEVKELKEEVIASDGQVTVQTVEERSNSEEKFWIPGSLCRAVYSEDGLFYPAEILWIKGQRCRVRYDKYNNEEEVDLSSLLHPDELHGPSRATSIKGGTLKFSSSGQDRRRQSRDDKSEERGGRRAARREEHRNSSTGPESFLPPPHHLPVWMFQCKEDGGSGDVSAIAKLLSQWYMCGFHTGSYMTQQKFKSMTEE